jgi:membrane associated rhomboid family serine protease
MALPWCRVLIVIIVAVSDIAVYFYGIYVSNSSQVPIGYAAHISGAIAGLLVGIVCLKNLRWEHQENIFGARQLVFLDF